LQELRQTVYALLHALDFSLDEAIPMIGLWSRSTAACPDRALAAGQPLERWRDSRQSDQGQAARPQQRLSTGLSPALGDSADLYLVSSVAK
jgi:hypothetical protein